VTGGLLYFLDTPGVQSRGAIPLTDEAGGKGTALVPLLSPELVGAAFSASF
jgi:hypothetical protein